MKFSMKFINEAEKLGFKNIDLDYKDIDDKEMILVLDNQLRTRIFPILEDINKKNFSKEAFIFSDSGILMDKLSLHVEVEGIKYPQFEACDSYYYDTKYRFKIGNMNDFLVNDNSKILYVENYLCKNYIVFDVYFKKENDRHRFDKMEQYTIEIKGVDIK